MPLNPNPTPNQELTPYAADLEENWGPPPGNLNSDGQNLLVYGKTFGNIFIGVQPSFGYEGDPMRSTRTRARTPPPNPEPHLP